MSFIPFETMHSAGLHVRPLNPDHCRALFEQMFGHEETMRDLVLERHADAWATEDYITDSMLRWRSGTRFRYGLFCPDGELTAVVELTPRLPQVELGVMISRRGGARNRRAGICALPAIIDTVIMLPDVYRIRAYCAIDGRAFSSTERLGFKREGTLVSYAARPTGDSRRRTATFMPSRGRFTKARAPLMRISSAGHPQSTRRGILQAIPCVLRANR